MQIISYILSVLSLASMITASLIKGERIKRILFFVLLGNLLMSASYLVGGKGINGAAACLLGTVMCAVNYLFDSKNKALPKWLIAIYVIAIVAVNTAVAGGISMSSIIVIIASLTFIAAIVQKNGAGYRVWTIINVVLWCIYDVITGAYEGLVTHFTMLVFTVCGIIIHDIKKRKNS